MQSFSRQAIIHAAETLELCGMTDKQTLRQHYLELCKRYHPDTSSADTAQKFQNIHESYTLLIKYIESFKFRFDENEFKGQYPFFDEKEGKDWLYGI